jgi:hypothetical protein
MLPFAQDSPRAFPACPARYRAGDDRLCGEHGQQEPPRSPRDAVPALGLEPGEVQPEPAVLTWTAPTAADPTFAVVAIVARRNRRAPAGCESAEQPAAPLAHYVGSGSSVGT